MKDYQNVILLRDKDSKYEDIDLVIFTNEETRVIERYIEDIKLRWSEEDCEYSLLDEIIEVLTIKHDCVVYTYPIDEIYY